MTSLPSGPPMVEMRQMTSLSSGRPWLTRDISDGARRYHGAAGRLLVGSDKRMGFNPDRLTPTVAGGNVSVLYPC